MKWCTHDARGMILQVGSALNSATLDDFSHFSEVPMLNIPEHIILETYYVDNGAFVAYPPQPSTFHEWNWTDKAWIERRSLIEAAARQRRAALLAESDWTQLPDVPLETRAAWASYRQALRDVTEQLGFPASVAWPAPPG